MGYSRPYVHKTNGDGTTGRYTFPVMYNARFSYLKTVVPFRGNVPCVGYSTRSYDNAAIKDWIYHYIHIPYEASLTSGNSRMSSITITNSAITSSSNCLASKVNGSWFRIYVRPLDVFNWISSQSGTLVGNFSGIEYKKGVDTLDLGDYVLIPIMNERTRILVSFAYTYRVTGTLGFHYNSQANYKVHTRQVYWNGNRLTPSQLSQNISDYAQWTYDTFADSGGPTNNMFHGVIQGAHEYVWDGTHTYMYLEMPRVCTTGLADPGGNGINDSLTITDYFFSVAEYNMA